MNDKKTQIAKHINEVCIQASCLMCAEADRHKSYKDCPFLSLKQIAREREINAEDVPDELTQYI